MATNQSSALDIIYSPQQVGRIASAYIIERSRGDNRGVPLGINSLDAVMNPLLPGDLVSIIARPGHGKTGFMLRWARWWSRHIQVDRPNHIVVYITYEQHIEDLESFHVASELPVDLSVIARGELNEEQIEQVNLHGLQRAGLPLWYVGHSMERRKMRPKLDVGTIGEALRAIEDWSEEQKMRIDLVFWDYLQRVPLPKGAESKTVGIDQNLNDIKDLGLSLGCPMVVGVQARRDVDGYKLQIPGMDDGQWTSAIEQVSDKVYSLARPCKYIKQGDTFGSVIVQGFGQMCVSLLKQKLGKDNIARWVEFDPAYNKFNELEEKYVIKDGQVI